MDKKETMKYEITLFENDDVGIHPYDNDPMVITVRCGEWEIKRVLIDHGSYVDIVC